MQRTSGVALATLLLIGAAGCGSISGTPEDGRLERPSSDRVTAGTTQAAARPSASKRAERASQVAAKAAQYRKAQPTAPLTNAERDALVADPGYQAARAAFIRHQEKEASEIAQRLHLDSNETTQFQAILLESQAARLEIMDTIRRNPDVPARELLARLDRGDAKTIERPQARSEGTERKLRALLGAKRFEQFRQSTAPVIDGVAVYSATGQEGG